VNVPVSCPIEEPGAGGPRGLAKIAGP
jgi:hypothetical protein